MEGEGEQGEGCFRGRQGAPVSGGWLGRCSWGRGGLRPTCTPPNPNQPKQAAPFNQPAAPPTCSVMRWMFWAKAASWDSMSRMISSMYIWRQGEESRAKARVSAHTAAWRGRRAHNQQPGRPRRARMRAGASARAGAAPPCTPQASACSSNATAPTPQTPLRNPPGWRCARARCRAAPAAAAAACPGRCAPVGCGGSGAAGRRRPEAAVPWRPGVPDGWGEEGKGLGKRVGCCEPTGAYVGGRERGK